MYLKGRDPLHVWALENPRMIEADGESIPLAPLEHVIVRKLEFYREGGSEKHVEDIHGVLRHSEELLDEQTLNRLIEERGLQQVWRRVRS